MSIATQPPVVDLGVGFRASRDAALAALAAVRLRDGRVAEAEWCARDLLNRPHAASAGGSARLTLVEALQVQDRMAEAAAEAEASLADPTLSPVTRARLRAERARALVLGRDPCGAAASAAGCTAQDPVAACLSRAALSMVASGRGRTRLALDLADDAARRGLRGDSTGAVAFARFARAVALARSDEPDEARQAVDTAADPLLDSRCARLRAALDYLEGHWDAVPAKQPAFAALVAVHRNDLAGAEALLAGESRPDPLWSGLARARCAEAGGRVAAAARADLQRAWLACTRRDTFIDYALLGPDLVRLQVATADPAAARAAAAQVGEVATRCAGPGAQSAALRCATALGAAGAAEQLLALLPHIPYPHLAALAAEEAAALLPHERLSLLHTARDEFRRLGARRDEARVAATLRSLGVRGGRRRRRAASARGWDGLTSTELEIVALATQGLTNREIAERLFVSPRTVDTHLTHVFAKLDVPGRAGLRSAAAQRPRN